MQLTRDDLAKLCPRPTKEGQAQDNWDAYINALISAAGAAEFLAAEVNTRDEFCAVIANMAQETGDEGGFTLLWENMTFTTVAAVRGAWKARASRHTDAWIKANLLRKPQAIAEWAYAGRMGNGPAGSGDGFKYRGFGALQTTGKTDHLKLLKGDYSHLSSIRAALHEWRSKGCNDQIADGDFEGACILINGGRNGLSLRKKYYAKALTIWKECPDFAAAVAAPGAVGLLALPPEVKTDGRVRAEAAVTLASTSRKWWLMAKQKLLGHVTIGGTLTAIGLNAADPVATAQQTKSLYLEFGLAGIVLILAGTMIYMATRTQSHIIDDKLSGGYVPSDQRDPDDPPEHEGDDA